MTTRKRTAKPPPRRPRKRTAPALAVVPRAAHPEQLDVSQRVGARLREMRAARRLTLDALAAASGLSRAELSDIEREKKNPSLGTIWRIAVGMGVPFAELLRGNAHGASVLRRGAMETLRSDDGNLESRPLTPAGIWPSVELYHLTLKAGAVHEAEPHATGTHEVLIVLSGTLRLRVGPGVHDLGPGDSVSFRADVSHAYENPGSTDATYHNVILYPS